MKVLFTHPFFWPYVRRGAERELYDAGIRLGQAGHDVSLLTTKPRGLHRHTNVEGLDVRYVRSPLGPLAKSRGWNEASAFARPAYVGLQLTRADLVHAWHYADGAAAVKAARRRYPVVMKLTGTVIPERIKALPIDGPLIVRAIEGADEVWCNSVYAREIMAGFGRPMRIVPPGVDPATFYVTRAKSVEPTAFVASASDEPRKRLVDIVDAWPEVVGSVPTATLRVAGHASAETRASMLARIPEAARQSITFLGLLDDAALRDEFSSAWCTLAPAVYEAFGLVTVESWACGTRVLGARSGATEELVANDALGALVEPLESERWSEGIVSALSSGPPVASAECQEAAGPFHWDQIMPTYLERYSSLLSAR